MDNALLEMERKLGDRLRKLVRSEVEEIWKKERKVIEEMRKAVHEAKNRTAWNEQCSCKASIRIHGKKEEEGENVEEVTIKVLKDASDLNVKKEDIEIVHRTGRRG